MTMSRSDLYPEPPHLTIAVYPAGSESKCFGAVCELLAQRDCRPSGTIEVAPWEVAFELRSDLVGHSRIIEEEEDHFQRIVAGRDSSRRPVQAGYCRGRSDVVVVQYLASSGSDRHPIAVSINAGALGIPVEMWRMTERNSGRKLARWAVDLLREITTRCDALYGAIGVEFSLATPIELANGVATLPAEVFLSRRLAFDLPGIRDAFADDFRDAETAEWPAGWFYSGVAPLNPKNSTRPQPSIRPTRAATLLGRSILKG